MIPRSSRSVLAAGAVLALLATAVVTPLAAAHNGRYKQYGHPSLAVRLVGSPGTVGAGQQVTYTATIVNTGRRADASAGFKERIPGKASIVSTSESQGGCTGNPVVTCNLGSLARGASATVTIVVTASQPGQMTDVAWVSTNPPGGWYHRHQVTTTLQGTGSNVGLKLAKSPGSFDVGQQATYTATISNSGSGAASNVAFQDLLPGKASLVSTSPSQGSCSGSPVVLCSLGLLNAGASATVSIVVTADKPGWMTDHGWVSINPPGNWQHERTVSVFVHNVKPNVGLKLTGSPGTVDAGQQMTYTATVTNSGSGAASNVAFQDLLPGKASLVSTSPSQGSCSGNPVVLCSLGALNAGASATVTIVVTANKSGTMTDHGWVSTSPPGHWQHERSVNAYVRNVSPALALRLSGSPGAVTAGQQVTYTATVTNTGRGTDANPGFQDVLPANTTIVSTSPSQGTCSGSPTLACNLGALDPGASATITIVVTPDQPGGITDRAWVSTNPPGGWQHQHSVSTQVNAAPPVTTSATTTNHA